MLCISAAAIRCRRRRPTSAWPDRQSLWGECLSLRAFRRR